MNREQIKADCHRQERRTTPGGEKRVATINANRHEDGQIRRDAVAHRYTAESREYRHETRTTDGRTGSDETREARSRRTNWMAHNHPEA